MSGRNKQPLAVVQGKGKKHLTKAEIKERKEQEKAIKGYTDNIEPPAYLTAAQKKEFNRIANELVRIEILSNLDVDHLARYIDSKSEHEKISKELRKMKPTIRVDTEGGSEIVHNESYIKLRKTKNLLFNECRSAATDLGLTITSRLKLVIPTKEKEKPESKFAKFGRGNSG
ncbi:phage terminase small subunit P27 family [Bacillus sp. SCS-151]|uniref:phage terminase small subunit P27 family n=1 Tax=Nanhaiella sioensis TaxID=3115293 RepID=UPI003978C20A